MTDLPTAARALLDWAREHTSPTDANSPHALLVELAKALAENDKAAAWVGWRKDSDGIWHPPDLDD